MQNRRFRAELIVDGPGIPPDFRCEKIDHDRWSVMMEILSVRPGKTVIIIEHRLSTLRKIADKIMVLGPGGILEIGRHDEFVRSGGIYAEMAALQATA